MICQFNLKTYSLILFCLIFAGCETAKTIENAPTTQNQPASAGSGCALPPNPNRRKILAFGDSLTIGLGLTEKESYPCLLQNRLQAEGFDYEVVNAGVSGDTSGGGLERIDWSLNQPNIEIMILELGANDMLKGWSVEEMKTNLSKIIERAKSKNVKVLLCGMYAPTSMGKDYQNALTKAYKDLAAQHKIAFLPFFLENVGGVKTLNQADGIHPNAEGTKKVAETVYNSVKPLVKK